MSITPRRPQQGPDEADLEDRQAFEALVAESLQSTREAAGRWRDGLATIAGLLVAAIVFKGREDLTKLQDVWKVVISVLVVGGLAAVVGGLMSASSAASAQPTPVDLYAIRRRYGDIPGYRLALGLRAARLLRWARRLVLLGLPLLVAGAVALWWAPEQSQSPSSVQVISRTHGRVAVTCGKHLSLGSGRIVLDGRAPIASADILLLRRVPSC